MLKTRFVPGLLWAAMIVLGASAVFGQDYPQKPIRIITSNPGGGSDFDSRQIAQGMSGALGQPVIVDNRGSGVIPGQVAVQSPPDGYTLLVAGNSLWVGPLMQKTPYDPVRDLSPITLIERTVNIIAVHPSLPVKSLKELIALAKARPGELNYSSGSVGNPAHLSMELFKSMAGALNIVNVPYNGGPAQIMAAISGEVQVTISDSGFIAPQVKAGKLRALAVTSATPSALVPGLPTVAATLPGYESVGMTGIWAPAKTPAVIIDRLNREIVRFLNQPEVKERFLNARVEIVASSPEQFEATIKADIAKWGKVIKDAGIKIE